MSTSDRIPSFVDFTRWLAARCGSASTLEPTASMLDSARSARAYQLSLLGATYAAIPARPYHSEPLALLAAADGQSDQRPTQLTTTLGFGLWLHYSDESQGGGQVTVLVKCLVPEISSRMVGQMVFLRSGTARFESSPFNPDGEALILLPATLEILGDLVLEAPGE